MTPQLCSERIRVGDWHSKPCGRTAVEDGLCKLHLRVRDRQREKDRKWVELNDRDERVRTEARELSTALGVPIKAESTRRGYTGNFVVPADWLHKIVEAHGG